MSTLKKRSAAITVAVIVILFGTLFGVHRTIAGETKKIEAMFYNGVYIKEQNYTQPGIGEQLNKRETAALGLITIANNYDGLTNVTESLRQQRIGLIDAETISGKYFFNEKLQVAYETLYDALISQSLSDREKAAAQEYAATLDGAQGVIQNSAYNNAVSSFARELGAFPVNILKNLVFATGPEYFGAEG